MPMIGGTNVPQQYVSYVNAAAAKTGLPAAVVAAQINDESGFRPGVSSSAGAEGIAQFLPSTFSSYGTGSPFNVADAFNAYANYMSTLLKQFHGNITDALAAYNAGPGNIGAGLGYARTILGNSGSSATHATTSTNASGAGTAGNRGSNASGTATGSTATTGSGASGTPVTDGSTGAQNQGQSAIAGTGGFDPLGLLSDVTGLVRDVATVLDYVFGMFGRGQGWRLAFWGVALISAYGSYRCLANAGAIPDLGAPKLAML